MIADICRMESVAFPSMKNEQSATTGVDWHAVLGSMWQGIQPALPYLAPLLILLIILTMPLPGRGPGSRKRDPWRVFKYDARRAVLARAGNRCEAAALVFVLRCPTEAAEADHVYPWSKGGATVISNGQALCRGHNRSKSNLTPPWWYVLLLERRRRNYFPADASVRVSGAIGAADKATRRAWADRRNRR